MRITRQYDITDTVLQTTTYEGLDIEADVSLEYGKTTVNAVYVNGKNLFAGDSLSKSLACTVADIIEDDDDVLAELMASDGIAWTGRTPNDPYGRMRARA